MALFLRRRIFRGIILCSAIGFVGLLLLLHFTELTLHPQESRFPALGFGDGNADAETSSKTMKAKRFVQMKLVSEDNNTTIESPYPETKVSLRECSLLKFDSLGPLPRASVIITFHNTETISSLLQTIHSVIQRTPPNLLEEVIVIDDCSSKDDLSQILNIYLDTVFSNKVKLFRNSKNLGLIQSRLKGSRLSSGKVIVFMDSHSEVQPTWLEPLLFEIKKNRRTLAHSYIDWMSKKDDGWHYVRGGSTWIVFFDWRFVFGWQSMSKKEQKQRKPTTPVKCKVVIGAYTAIDRSFFQEIGELDEGMEFWGGENIDLALRVWLFGGQVLCVPCSRVAHLEGDDTRAYRNSKQSLIARNYKRVAEVWLDEYKRYFYQYRPELIAVDPGDLTERRKLKTKALHDFTWYLTNVFPELGIPSRDSFAYGNLKNSGGNLCLHSSNGLRLKQCAQDQGQIFYWSQKFEFRQPVEVYNVKDKMGLYNEEYMPNFGNDLASKWIHWKNGPMMELSSGLCMTKVHVDLIDMVYCNHTKNPKQIWNFEHYSPHYLDIINGNFTNWTAYANITSMLRHRRTSF